MTYNYELPIDPRDGSTYSGRYLRVWRDLHCAQLLGVTFYPMLRYMSHLK